MKNYLIFIFIFLWLFSLSFCDIFCRYQSVLCASFKLLLLLFQARERIKFFRMDKKERKKARTKKAALKLMTWITTIEAIKEFETKNDDYDDECGSVWYLIPLCYSIVFSVFFSFLVVYWIVILFGTWPISFCCCCWCCSCGGNTFWFFVCCCCPLISLDSLVSFYL